MNNNAVITLAPNVTIKYIDDILVGGKNYYKYEAKVNDNQKNLYLNEKIGNDSKQKNVVYNFILNNENTDSTDIFLDLDIKDEVNSTDSGGNGGDVSVQKSRNQNPKLSENWRDYIDNALISIRNTSNCSIGVIENFFNKESSISGRYKYIDDNMAESKNLYNKMLNSGKGGSGDLSGMVTNYRDAFNDIAYGILEMFDAAQTEAINSGELKMMDDKSKEYFGTESFNNEFKDILSNSKLELKKTNNNFLFKDMFKEIGALQAKYSVASLSENESIFKSISNSIDDNIDEDMKDKVDELVKFMASFLGISELEARNAIKENPIEMANQLYDAQMSIAENVKNGGSGYDAPEISTSFWEFKDAFYSTDAGKEALFNRFLTSDSDVEGEFPKNITPYDEKNSIAYTNYITYCMQIGKLNWLMDSCKEFPVVIDKINNNDVFTVPEEVTDTNTLSYIAKNIEDYNVAPFGYVKKGDKWYQVNYNKRGQDMLYYMDYHCGENSSNSGDNRVITAFSNQGRLDSIGRNYKGLWIDSHLNGDYDKNSSEYKSAERDYYVLNGVIEDKKRYNELTESGELSFKDLVKYSGLSDSEKDKLTDINYINEHKDEIKETMDLSEKQLYNFSVSLSTDGINSGDPVLDARLAASRIALSTIGSAVTQFGGGLFKFFENVGDAANTAIHSDFVLGSVEYDYTNWDGTSEPNTKFDLTKEFKEFRDSTWKDFYESEKYNEEFSSFKDSAAGVKQLNSRLYQLYHITDANLDEYFDINGKKYFSVDEIPNDVKEEIYSLIFKQNKLTEWNLKDTSSSNFYLAAFKEGIREGGNFTRFDNLSDKVVENAKIQFKAQEEVEVDKTGEWMESNIYNTDFYKNMEDYSFVKKDNILGMMFNQVGNMAVPIGLSMIPGVAGVVAPTLGAALAPAAGAFQAISSATLFTSAFGGAAEEAFINGASYNEALKYATLSATTELAIEHVFSGIGGYGEGWLDDVLEYLPNKFFASTGLDTNLTAQTLKTLITGGLGEAVEEVTTDFVTPLWQSMTYMNDKTYYDVLNENVSLGSLAQTALVSFLSSMIFKGVEINQQTSAFNKNFTNLQNRISSVSNLNLDSNVLEAQAKKVLAQYVGGIIENEGVIKSDLLEQLIKNASNQLVSVPKSREQLSKLQDELVSFKNQEVTIGEGKNSINVTGSELLKLEDYSGFDGKYTIEDGKIKFEDEKTQNRFNSSILDLAQKQIESQNSSLKKLVIEFQNSKDSVNANNKVNNLQDAISTIIEYDNNKFDTNDLVFFEYKGETLLIPRSIVTATTTKLSIEEGKISFKKDMNGDKFIGKLYDKAIGLCNEQIRKNTYDINKITNKGLVNKAIDIIKPSLENGTPLTFITGITQTENDNLTKIDVEATINGEQKNISVYIDGNTDSSVYKQGNKLTELIQKTIMKKENSDLNNIYLGELVYDSKTGEFNSIQNVSNMLYVQSLEFENAKRNANSQALRSAINKVNQSRNDLTNSTYVTIKYNGDSILIPETLLKEITSKYKIIDGVVKFNQDMNIDKFVLEIYDKAISINNNTIDGINNMTIKNSTYIDTDGMDLYRLEVETIIDGKTRTVNVYVDGNTDISSIKDSSKISEKLYQLITQNKNLENIYAGNIKYNEKTGVIDATYNEANKLYVDSISKIYETTVQNETSINEEVNEDNNEIKKGIKYEYNIEEDGKESYEYTIEEVKDDDSVAKPTKNVEVKENATNVDNGSVITNVAGAASVGVTAGATSQAIYQNNAEVVTQNAKSQTKVKNVQSNIKNKENIHDETNNNVISISEIKSQVNSYIDSIKTECEKYIEMHKNDENFEHRFEQFKGDKIIEFNDKLSEVKKIIIDSNSAELNAINSKIDSLSENDSMRNELISKRDEIMNKQQQEISDIETSANQKLQKVFSELVVNTSIAIKNEMLTEMFGSLELSKEFVSALTTKQKDFLTQVLSEQGLIEYLQNNPLIKVDLLERSELANTDNKYVNKLIQLISENQGTTKQIYNVMDVVKNNSTPILVDSTYKGDTHTLSTNEVLDFMKTGKVDTKYSYSDYVKATNTLMNDIASQNASIDINGDVFNGISMYNDVFDYLVGNKNFIALDNLNIIEKCNEFYEFISKNNISLDSAVMEKLDFISKLEENKTIANLNDYFNGKSPIVMDKYIRVYGREISTQSLIDLVEMKSPNYLILLRDYKISSIPNSERFIITSAIDKLMSSNTDLAEYYKSNYEKFNNLYQNKYVLKNSYILVPSTFGKYPTKYIDHVLHNPYAISIYDGMERQQIISTVNAFTKYLDENNLSSYYSSSKLDFLNRKVVDIDSSVSYTTELLKMFDTNGESFGANQGAVRELIIRLKMNDAVQSIFGNKIETKDFMETLNNMNFTEEQFKNALLTVNVNNLLPLGDIEMLNTLIEQVVDNYPGMSKKDALQFLYLLESKEAGGSGICNYASMVNLIFDKYKNNIDLFEKHFGYPMYLTINGKEQLNTTRLLVDMYSTINEGLLVTKENGTYKVATSSKVYRNLTRDFYGDISKENFERFLTKKGIKFNINEKFTYSTVDPDNMFHYEEIITSVRESLAKGEHVHLTSMNFSLYNLDGSIFNYDIEPHIMSVVGINEDGKLLVDSWGKKLLFDLREELARLTNDDLSLDALKIKHYTTIVSYDISLDNNSNHSTSLDIKTDVNKERNTYNGSYTEVFDEPSSSIKSNVTSSVITKEDLEFIDEGIDTKDALASKTSTQDDLRNVGNASNTVINDSKLDRFDIVIDGKVEATLKIDELVRSGSKISDCYELMEESQYDEFNSAIVNYIDYVRENNISVDIDSNVMKFYESYKYAKENDVFIVNEDRILEKGADMIAIPQEIHNKYKNDLIYQEIVDTIIESVQSLENFEKFISIHYLSNDMYMIYMNDVINCIEPSIKANENFNAMSNVISKLNEYAIKDFGLFLSNIHEMIYENANPVYLPYYINGEFKNGHQAISTSILLDTILGKNQFPSSYNSNIIENCRVLYNYLQSNNITLNENIMEKLEFVNSLNEDQIILNVSEYFEGKSPIVTTEFIYLQDARISSLDIIEILKMESDEYIKLLRDGTCEFKDIKSNNLILSIQRLLSQNQILREQYNENYIKLKDLYNNNYVLKNTLTIVPKTFKGYYTSLIDNILNNPNTINAYSISEKHNLVIAINDFIEYLKSNNIEIEYHEYEKVLEFLNRNVPNIDSSIAIKSEFALELETNVKNGGAFGSDQGIIRALFKKVNMNTVIEKIFGNNVETKELLEVLNQMNISDEEFTRQLLKTNRGLLFAKNTTEIKMIEDLANQVMKNYPGMNKKEAIQFLYLMETEEAGGTGICNYASLVNLIFNKYMSNPSLFEEKLGYPMYVIIDGKRQLNTATLLVDLYSIINEDVLVTKENGVYKVNTSNENYLNLSDNGKLAIEYFQKFLDKKGIDMKVKESFAYSSIRDLMHYEEVITNIHESIAKGEHVHIAARYFDICYPNGNFAYRGVGGHIMSVLEITKEGHLIVDSWGKRLMIDLKTQMSNLGDYNSYANVRIVSYDISSDNASNILTSLDINTDVNNDRSTHNSAHIEVFDVPSDSIKSNVTSSVITDEDLKFIDEGIDTKDTLAPDASIQDVQSNVDSDLVSTVNIDGIEIEVETLKQLQTPINLETALKTCEYAGVRVEKALVELSKLDGVTLDSKLQELVKLYETLRQDEIIFNIEDVYSNGGTANIINIDVYNEFRRNNPNSNISLDDLYGIINSNSLIYRLISNDTIIKNVSNESIKESLSYLVSISNRYNYENKVIRETQYLLNLLEDNYTTEELYDAFAIAHTEFNTPDVYYEFYDYLKTMDVDSAVKLLESKGYTTLDITDSFLNLAIRMDSQELSKRYYYRAFDYLVENGMNEKEAATIVRDKYRTLLYRRGTRVVTTTPNGVKIRVVNNISSNNKLFTIEKIESMIKQAEKYYSKTGLKEIVIFDSFAPHNIYSEKVQYEDYVKTHNNRRFVSAASATKSSILLWEDFNKLDSIVHEYGHTIDKHIKVVNKLSTDFSSSSIWLEAIQKDTSITSKRVSEYAYASNGEDFAEFLKYFNRNLLEVARKYPNRYKAASKYLNLDIDSNTIERYLDSKQVFIQGIEDLSNLLTEDGSMLEFIKQYVFEDLKGNNSIAKTVISELDAVYESRMEIIEDYGVYSLFMDMREQERIGSHEFLKIMKDYLDGKDISSKFKDSRNLGIIELLEKEEIQEWYEEELNDMTAETEKIEVSDEDFEKMMNSLFNDTESNSSSDTSVIEENETMDFTIHDVPTTQDLEPYKVVSKNNHEDLIITNDLVEQFSQESIDEFVEIYENNWLIQRHIEDIDMNYIRKTLDIINSLGVDIDSNSTLSKIKRLFEPLDGRHVFNISGYLYSSNAPLMLPKELYSLYSGQIDNLYRICSNAYDLANFLANPDLKILSELKEGLFKDTRFDSNMTDFVQRLYKAVDILLEDKVIINAARYANSNNVGIIAIDKKIFEQYNDEFKLLTKITNNINKFVINPDEDSLLTLKKLFSEVNIDTTNDKLIDNLKNIIDDLLNGKIVANASDFSNEKNPVIVSKSFYELNKDIIDKYIDIVSYSFKLENFLKSFDVNTAIEIKKLIDSKEVKINNECSKILDSVINDIVSGNNIINLNSVIYGNAKPITISSKVYNDYVNLSPNYISIDDIYRIFNSKDLIYRLLNNHNIISNVSNENIIESIKFLSHFAEENGYSDEVINEIKFYLDVMSDTPDFIPKIFNGCYVRGLEILLNNPTKINGYTTFEKEIILKALDEYSKFIKNNYPIHYMSYADNIKALTRNTSKIGSNIAIETELCKMFDNIGKIFGADQGAVRKLFTRIKINDAVQFLCGNKIETVNFMETLNNMHFTEEKFKNVLLKVNNDNKFFLTDKNTFDSLKKQVIKNYPGMSEKEAIQFLYLVETYETGGRGICNYASTVNLIFNKYKNNPRLFEEHFGYPMYVTVDGKNELNTTMLLVDMYSIINDGVLVVNEDGAYKVETSNEEYLHLSDNGELVMKYFQKFLDRKGIEFNIEVTYAYHSALRSIPNSTDMMHYEEVITNIHDCLVRGEHVDISAYGFNLYSPGGTIEVENFGGHIMTVVGITSDGNLIVDSWGEKLLFNLKEQMSNLGDVYNVTSRGIELRKRVNIVSYDISLDNSSNISTGSNIGEDIYNSTDTQAFGGAINSPKSSVTSTIDADTDLDFVDVSEDIRNVDSLMSGSVLSQNGNKSVAETEKMIDRSFNYKKSNSSSDTTNDINYNNTDISFENEVENVNDEINKILKGEFYLEKFIKSKDISLARLISNLIKSGNVDLSSPIGIKLKQIVDAVADNGHLINLDAFVYGTESPIVVNDEVYTEYERINPGKKIEDLYKIVKNNSLYDKLSGKERNMYIKSIDTLLGLSNDKNALINELEFISKAIKEDPNNAFDIISKYHMETKLPQGYSEYSDLLKSGLSINEAISQLENLGYSYSEISYIVMSEAMTTYNSDSVQKSYYDMFEYLKQKFIEENPKVIKEEQELIKYAEQEAAKKVRKNLTELFQIRGSKPVLVTSSLVEIRVVNNAQIDSTFIENISEQLSKIENIYGRSALETIVIYDTISPENLINEIIKYPNYRVKFPNKHFMTQASATRTNINIYNSFNSLDTLSHEYGHTLDKGPLSTRVYDEKKHTFKTILFSESGAWQRAVKIDNKSVSSYGDLNLEEDFADFIKAYTKNPVATMLKYPNRYLEMSSKLGIKTDEKVISEYMSNTRLIDVLNSISNIIETSTLDLIKEYVFNGQIDNNGYTFIDDILKSVRYDKLLNTIDASSVINEIQKSYNLTDEKVTFLLEQIIRGNNISDLLSESDIKLIELLDDERLKETYRDYLEINDVSTKNQIIKDADVDMAFPKKSIFSKRIETVSVSDIPRVFRNMNTTDIISILEGKTTLMNDENFINNKKSIIRFVKYLSENNIKLSLNERANTIIENLRNGDFRLNILNFSDVLNGDAPMYGPSSISLDGIKISTDDVMAYLENKKNEISSIITSETPNEDARDLLNAIDELGSKNDIIYDKYRKSIKLIERIERSYVYKSYDSYYLLPKSFNGIDTSNILNSDMLSLVSYINSLSNADKKSYRVALDEFGKYIYKTNTRLSKQDLSRVNKLYDVINTKKFSTDAVIKSKVYDTFEMSYQNDGEFGSNQGKVREVIEKLGITDVIQGLFSEKVERSKFLQILSEFNISERDFITALNKRTQMGIMNDLFKDGDINLELYGSLIRQVKMNYPNMSTMEAVRFLYLIETKEAGGPGICNNPILVNMIFDRYVGRENIFERDFGYPMYINANNDKKVLNEARLLVDIFSTLNDGVLVHNVNGNYVINKTSVNYVRTYDLNGLRLDAVEKFINKKGLNINVSKSYFFNSNEELMHYDYLMEQIKSELDKGNYVIFGGKGFDMDVENFEYRKDCDAHGMTIVGIDTNGELILDSWGMKARVDLKKELSRLNTMFKDRNSNMVERIFTISSYNIN